MTPTAKQFSALTRPRTELTPCSHKDQQAATSAMAEQERPPVPDALLRLPEVLKIVPISRSAWWEGVRQGTFPAARKLSPRCTVWAASDIYALVATVKNSPSA